jgi:hypothetical protein
MRLSGLIVTVFLIFAPALLAQHSGGGSSSASSSGGGSHASSGGSSGGASHSSGGGSHGGSSSAGHASGGHSSGGQSHAAAGAHSNTRGTTTSTTRQKPTNASPYHDAPPTSHAPISDRPPISDHARMRENGLSTAKPDQPEKRGFFSFLRHPFPRPKPKPVLVKPTEADLRHKVCLNGPCATCPPGTSRGKGGACGTGAPVENAYFTPCQGEPWNISGCAYRPQCRAGMRWDGRQCVSSSNDCASITGRAESLANEIRMSKNQMQAACSNNVQAPACDANKQQYDGAVLRYRMLQNEAPAECRSRLVDPLAF